MPRTSPLLGLLSLLVSFTALGQGTPDGGASSPGEVALAPSRLELAIPPGGSQTVVVNVISSAGGPNPKPIRLFASLGDFTLTRSGAVQFAKPGTLPRSAADWMIYTPVELTVRPGQTHAIRVTVDVPKEATPGDYTAVMFVEERPPDLKVQQGRKQILFHFRLAAVFYVLVPPLTPKGALTGLDVTVGETVSVRPTLKNEGNTRLRPLHSFEVLDASGQRVAEFPTVESQPVLAGFEYVPELTTETLPPPGEYTLKYRVDFRDGAKVIEGRKTFVVPKKTPAVRTPGSRSPARAE